MIWRWSQNKVNLKTEKEITLENEGDLKTEDNLKNEDDQKMKMTSKMKTTSKMIKCGGLSSLTMYPAPDNSKSYKWQPIIANWNYSGLGRLGSAWVGPIVIIELSQSS